MLPIPVPVVLLISNPTVPTTVPRLAPQALYVRLLSHTNPTVLALLADKTDQCWQSDAVNLRPNHKSCTGAGNSKNAHH